MLWDKCARKTEKAERGKKEKPTEHPADSHHGLEDGVGEAGPQHHSFTVGQTQFKWLMLRHEQQTGISVNPVFLQSPGCPQEPLMLLLPPQRMIRPVTLHLCIRQERNTWINYRHLCLAILISQHFGTEYPQADYMSTNISALFILCIIVFICFFPFS